MSGRSRSSPDAVASLYRALSEVEDAAVGDGLPLRPKPFRIRRPEDPLTAEEIGLRNRLQSQPNPELRQRPAPGCYQLRSGRG
ncbi:hypothetical protein ACH5AP_39310 [Streptomyces anulatus]